jgi:diguanylate cyclase (GGDEF)-like protein
LPSGTTTKHVVFRAALSRFVLGSGFLALVPLFYPRAIGSWWVYAMYLGVAAIEQILIRNDIGGDVRSFVAGVFDAALITFVVHRLGSSATIFASFYFLACAMNVMVVGVRVGMAIAAFNAVAYGAVVWCEHFGVLAFAPDAPEIAVIGPPTAGQAFSSTALIALSIAATTTVVSLLANQLQARQRELVLANDQLAELSQRDPLTNLANRRHLFAQIERELLRLRRGHPLAVIMIDLDHFKNVNDHEGHHRGDQLLKDIAAALVATTRESDVTGRYGGDEFVVALPDTAEPEARVAAQRIADAVREAGRRASTAHPVTASVGLAFADREDTVATLLRRADQNAYRAKRDGGDRVAA